MGRFKFSALVGAAIAFIPSAGALAADIPEIPPPPHFAGKWYLRGDIGFSNQRVGSLFNALYPTAVSVVNVSKEFSAAPLFGLGIGFQHNENLRFDLTGEYRGGAVFTGLDIVTATDPADNGTDEYTAIKREWTFLANAYWDFNEIHGFTPFIGVGIGASLNTIAGFTDVNTPQAGVAYGATHSQWNLAWALHAGASYKVNDRLSLEMAYRYIDLGNAASGDLIAFDGTNAIFNPMEFRRLTSHDFKMGFRWALDHGQGGGYYPPVVKY